MARPAGTSERGQQLPEREAPFSRGGNGFPLNSSLRIGKSGHHQAGFTLIEFIAVLVLLGFLLAMGGTGMVTTVQGYLLARENTAMSQKAQLALTRLTNEFRVCYNCTDPGVPIDINIQPFNYTNVIGNRTLNQNNGDLTLNGDTLVDRVGSFTLAYDVDGTIRIQLGLIHQQAGTTRTFTTRVLPRNTFQ